MPAAKKEAATTMLLEELREAWESEREFDLNITKTAIELGADLRGREEASYDSDSDDEVMDDDLYIPMEFIALHTKVGDSATTKEVIDLMIQKGGNQLLEKSETSTYSPEDTPLGLAIRYGNFSVANQFIEKGSNHITEKVWKECNFLLPFEEIIPTLHKLYDECKASDQTVPLWLRIRLLLTKTENTEILEKMTSLQLTEVDEKMIPSTVVALDKESADYSATYELAQLAYSRLDSHRSFEDAIKQAATHALLIELRWAQKTKRAPDQNRVTRFLSHGANPNTRENDLTDFDSDYSDVDSESSDDYEDDLKKKNFFFNYGNDSQPLPVSGLPSDNYDDIDSSKSSDDDDDMNESSSSESDSDDSWNKQMPSSKTRKRPRRRR